MSNSFFFNCLDVLFLRFSTSYHWLVSFWEHYQQILPGKFVDLGGYKIHYDRQGKGNPTVIIDHSLGGIEGYLLIKEIAKLTQVFIYERPGYGWSDSSPKNAVVKKLSMN